MYKTSKLLLLLALMVAMVVIYNGCSQPEDVVTPISKTNMYLDESLLPTTPPGMVYELWLANANDTVSIGKFVYNNDTRIYLNTDMTAKADSNKFSIEEDIDNYDVIFLSVETAQNDIASEHGPIMLIDFVASPTIKMKFPQSDSLWESTIRYDMESTSDGNVSSTDGYAIWFAISTEQTDPFNDTFLVNGVLDWSLDSTDYVGCGGNGNFVETNVIYGLENIHQKDTAVIFGLDTLVHTVVRYDVIESTKTCDYYPTTLNINYNISESIVTYNVFLQDNFALPDISAWGWKYKGWVVSPYIPQTAVGLMTLPGWALIGDELDQTDGGLLTTGTFSKVDAPDDGNPYSLSDRVPPFPGEDFLTNLPNGMSPVNLVPGNNGNPGRVFISIEPDNFVTDTTNFPLVPFLGELPFSRTVVTGTTDQQYTLRGWMQTNDHFRGFPMITVELERF